MPFLTALVCAVLSAGPMSTAVEPAGDTTQAQHDFAAANERALAGDTQTAIAMYDSLLDRGFKNEDVFFNLGNALMKAGRTVDAIVAYERALHLAPASDDILANLDLARRGLHKSLGVGLEANEDGGADLVETLGPLLAPFSPWHFAWVAILSNAVFFFSLGLRHRAASPVTRRRAGILLSLSLIALCVGVGVVGGNAWLDADHLGVITAADPLREGPHPKFSQLGPGIPGVRVRILGRDGLWTQVRRTDGITGWILSEHIAEI
ncbi:MAG: SH3 domain-containing protein [Deltaproteobacteria bacterium]|nr:SH3 domain-containing protein [Deltaproteobacteria bacterium]